MDYMVNDLGILIEEREEVNNEVLKKYAEAMPLADIESKERSDHNDVS